MASTEGIGQRQDRVAIKILDKLSVEARIALNSVAFMPWPMTSRVDKSAGRWLT